MSAPLHALMQAELEMPSVDKLRRAFKSVRCLTDLDAHTLARDAYGILVRRLNATDVSTLQGALKVEGVETEIVPEGSLPALPMGKLVHRLDCSPEKLIIYNPLGQSFPLEWGHIMLIAAGSVLMSDFDKVQTRRTVHRLDAWGNPHSDVVIDSRTREQMNHHWVLEIILTRAVMRYRATADKFNFTYLGERLTGDVLGNFRCLVQDMARFAPQAALNRGAHLLKENGPEDFSYPSKNAFGEEITWLLWRMREQ